MVNGTELDRLIQGHQQFIKAAEEAERYYRNENNIKLSGAANLYQNNTDAETNPLRTADNRISHSWHNLLVNQKAGYVFTYPPTFDVGSDRDNQAIAEVLGDDFGRESKNLAVDASNCGVSWLHYWTDDSGAFRYARVDPKQIIPVFSGDLQNELVGVLRAYVKTSDSGSLTTRCEYWDSETVRFYERETAGNYVDFVYPEVGSELRHNMGAVPFIPFYNNGTKLPDLALYKDLIDAYDRVVSGFANDIDDVQEVIFVIKNYGGEDKAEFLNDLKLKKTIKVDDEGGVDTIRAEIPHEARGAFLETVRKQIFVSGMGVDPETETIGNASGVALKFLYSLLELKAGLMETEFRKGYAELVRAICRNTGMKEPARIIQTWTRNMIQNDLETAQIAAESMDVISRRSILKNHPWVEDVDIEEAQLEDDAKKSAENQKDSFGIVANKPPDGEDDEE